MISLNESIDFEFFETGLSSNPGPKRKESSESTGTFLDVWEIDSGSLRYAGSHPSLINSLAFESNLEVKTDEAEENETDARRGVRERARYNEIKRTVALSSEQCESDETTSFAAPDNETIHPLDKNKKEEQTEDDLLANSSEIDENCEDKELNEKTEVIDELNLIVAGNFNRDFDELNDIARLASQEEEQLEETNERKNSDDSDCESNKEEVKEKSREISVAIEKQREMDTTSVQYEGNNKRDNNRCYENDEDEMYFYNRHNQITTVVEVHAENDMSENDNDSELDIGNDSLIPEVELLVNDELEIDINSEMCVDQKYFDNEQNGKVLDFVSEGIKSNGDENITNLDASEKIVDGNIKGQNENGGASDELRDEISSKTNDLFDKETAQILINEIKNYNSRSGDSLAQEYSYEAIEKKIESASKHIINVKSIIVNNNETKHNTNPTITEKTNKIKSKLESTKPKDYSILTRYNKTDDTRTKLQTYNITVENETLNVNRGRNTPRQELPLLNKPQTNKKIKSDIKPNKKEDKIPQIKNEASFDMRLLIKAINDMETTKPKTGCTRSNSGRSSETSKNSNNSRKTNSSTKSNGSNRPNMSFTKDEAKKIDLENQILLRKIMNQKPQLPPGVSHQIRRKPTAYINRQRLQDRITHDNTILERKLLSIKKRKERISVL